MERLECAARHTGIALGLLILGASLGRAQESYWIANPGTNNIMELDASGEVVRVIDHPGPTAVFPAPDGRLWVAAAITSNQVIVDPTVTPPLVTPIAWPGRITDLAFDRAGHAWVASGNVFELDANGNLLQVVQTSRAENIDVDGQGNKWVAHRDLSQSRITRIDGATGAVTSAASSNVLLSDILADFRGPNQASHIWVAGALSFVEEYDATGTLLQVHTLPSASGFSLSMTTDPGVTTTQAVWASHLAADRIDAATGVVTATPMAPARYLAVDHFGRFRATRASLPSSVARVDPTSPGVVEHPGTLSTVQGGVVRLGDASTRLGTLYHHALVVDPLGDLDSDGASNLAEFRAGSSPTDPDSTPTFSIVAGGVSQIGGSASLIVQAGAADAWFIGISRGVRSRGAGTTLAGWAGESRLDFGAIDPGTIAGFGPTTLRLAVPNARALQGTVLFLQGVSLPGFSTPRFSNVTSWSVW